MSREGKEVFLKDVIQAISTFVMSCFLLPLATSSSMRRSTADFWWGIEEGRQKMH
jgi:hypothetical protein